MSHLHRQTDSGPMRSMIDSALARYGVSGPSRQWLIKALHPASPDDSPGLPDESSTAVVRPNFRVTTTIHPQAGVTSWDCMIWTSPGDVNAAYYVTAQSPADFGSTSLPPTATYGVLQLQPTAVYGATNMINLASPIGGGPVQAWPASTSLPTARPAAFRHQYKSLTAHLVSSAISDQGEVYAAQYAPMNQELGGINTGHAFPAVTNTDNPTPYVARLFSSVLPTNETDLCATSPGAESFEAKIGVYMPLRLAGPSQPFCRATNPLQLCFDATDGNTYAPAPVSFTSWSPGNFPRPARDDRDAVPHTVSGRSPSVTKTQTLLQPPISRQLPCMIGAINVPTSMNGGSWFINDGSGVLTSNGLPWPFALVASTNNFVGPEGNIPPPLSSFNASFDTGFDNINNGVVFFRGLQGSGANGSSSIQLKICAGLETVPAPGAMDRVFVQDAVPYDPRTMQAYYAMVHSLADAYPASYNAFGDILDKIGEYARRVWQVASPMLRHVAPAAIDAAAAAAGMGAAMLGAPGLSGAVGTIVRAGGNAAMNGIWNDQQPTHRRNANQRPRQETQLLRITDRPQGSAPPTAKTPQATDPERPARRPNQRR